jgi:hypothetical protein
MFYSREQPRPEESRRSGWTPPSPRSRTSSDVVDLPQRADSRQTGRQGRRARRRQAHSISSRMTPRKPRCLALKEEYVRLQQRADRQPQVSPVLRRVGFVALHVRWRNSGVRTVFLKFVLCFSWRPRRAVAATAEFRRRSLTSPRARRSAQDLRSFGNRDGAAHRRASGRREHAAHHLPRARSRLPDGLPVRDPRRRRPKRNRQGVRRTPRRVARTQELLAARNLDHGRQFFTRAIDYGYSKSVEETMRLWDRAQSWAIRRAGDPPVSARCDRHALFPEARQRHARPPHRFRHPRARGLQARRRPAAYPEQLAEGLTSWQPKRILMNSGIGGGR